jgi:transposase
MPSKAIALHAHLSLEELEQRYRSCKDAKEKTRWQVICLYAQQTWENRPSTRAVSQATGLSQNWVYKPIRRYNAEGPQGLTDEHRHNPGGDERALLNQEERQALRRALPARPPGGGVWTARKVAPWVQAHTGQRMAEVTAWTYLRRLGFSLQGPRHTRAASAQEQVVEAQRQLHPDKPVGVWGQDEAWVGLKPILCKGSGLWPSTAPAMHGCTSTSSCIRPVGGVAS